MITSRHRKTAFTTLFAGLLIFATIHSARAFGIDKLVLNVDGGKDFSSISQVVLFNDNDEAVFVTGRPLTWDTDASGVMITAATSDLAISPPVARIAAKGSATFTVRYVGTKRNSEGTYRAAFKEVRVPTMGSGDGASSSVGSQITAGIMMTIPVFVSDFEDKAVSFKDVTANFHRTENGVSINVKNAGSRHVIVESVRQAGTEIKRLHSTLFANKEIRYEAIKTLDPSLETTIDLSYGADTQHIIVSAEK